MRSLGALAPLAALVLVACAKKAPPREEPAIVEPPATVPPVAPPPGEVLVTDAAPPVAQTPYEQARAYVDNGQVWLARLVLERKALGSDGTKPELELLSKICEKQGDLPCVAECARKLGKKVLDAGAPRPKNGRR